MTDLANLFGLRRPTLALLRDAFPAWGFVAKREGSGWSYVGEHRGERVELFKTAPPYDESIYWEKRPPMWWARITPPGRGGKVEVVSFYEFRQLLQRRKRARLARRRKAMR